MWLALWRQQQVILALKNAGRVRADYPCLFEGTPVRAIVRELPTLLERIDQNKARECYQVKKRKCAAFGKA